MLRSKWNEHFKVVKWNIGNQFSLIVPQTTLAITFPCALFLSFTLFVTTRKNAKNSWLVSRFLLSLRGIIHRRNNVEIWWPVVLKLASCILHERRTGSNGKDHPFVDHVVGWAHGLTVRFHVTPSRFHTNSPLWQFVVRGLDLLEVYSLTYRERNYRKLSILGFLGQELFFARHVRSRDLSVDTWNTYW